MKRRHYLSEIPWRTILVGTTRVLLLMALLVSACSGDHQDGDREGTGEQECVPGAHYDHYRMEFGLDYRDQGTLSFRSTCDQVEGTLTLGKGNSLIQGGVSHTGKGTLYRFPETGDSLYTMKFSGTPMPKGECGSSNISYSLSLSAKKGSSYLVGGLTAYCGKDRFYGRPARIMRISGSIEHILPERR